MSDEIHTTPSERLVMMANQIAKAFAPMGEARAVPKIAGHIKAFWDPRMRRKIDEIVAAGGAGLEPLALAALESLMAAPASTAPAASAAAARLASDGPLARDSVPSAAEHRSDHPGGAGDGSRWRFKLPGFLQG